MRTALLNERLNFAMSNNNDDPERELQRHSMRAVIQTELDLAEVKAIRNRARLNLDDETEANAAELVENLERDLAEYEATLNGSKQENKYE